MENSFKVIGFYKLNCLNNNAYFCIITRPWMFMTNISLKYAFICHKINKYSYFSSKYMQKIVNINSKNVYNL